MPRTTARASDLFDHLNKEEERERVRKSVAKNAVLEELIKDFERILRVQEKKGDRPIPEKVIRLPQQSYTNKEIEAFSIYFVNYQSEEDFSTLAGIYLNKLIQSCQNKIIAIHTHHYDESLDFPYEIGEKNKSKHIIIRGNAGNGCGSDMRGGKIHVKGNAGSDLGMMLCGGLIIVEGNAGIDVGDHMEGGAIKIKGNIGSLAETIMGGEIYHQGKCVVRDGELLT